MADPLSDLRSTPGLPARVGSLLFKGVREVEATRAPVADWWEAQNRTALATQGPLWVVLGDSTSQGIGSSVTGGGYVLAVRNRLQEVTASPWRVLNLSITGAKMSDVIDRQLAALADLDVVADLVTSFVGANDLLFPWGVDGAVEDAERLINALPPGALQSQMGGGPPSRPKANAVNDILRGAAADGAITVFDPWNWPTMRGAWAGDRFHPNDVGYSHLTEAIWPALRSAVV